jgi:hypothetical protein
VKLLSSTHFLMNYMQADLRCTNCYADLLLNGLNVIAFAHSHCYYIRSFEPDDLDGDCGHLTESAQSLLSEWLESYEMKVRTNDSRYIYSGSLLSIVDACLPMLLNVTVVFLTLICRCMYVYRADFDSFAARFCRQSSGSRMGATHEDLLSRFAGADDLITAVQLRVMRTASTLLADLSSQPT